MSGDERPSGEINILILQRITEVAQKVEAVANGQAELKSDMRVQFNDGKHRMDGLEERIDHLEENGCQKGRGDDDSDWSKPAKHKRPERSQRDVPTEPISKKLDMNTWIKIGWVIGAAVAGAFVAMKAGAAP
jgi:hypothetical protein